MSEPTPKAAKAHKTLYQRVTASVPLLITVIVHVVLIAIAAAVVVSQQLAPKKKVLEASNVAESSAQKQVEHRLQVARKAGGSSSTSPVSASRIFSTAQDALQLPAPPELPSSGSSALAGMGFGQGMGAMGTGSGMNTGLKGGTGIGSGFMSMSFLGMTDVRAQKVVFAIDISSSLLDIRKGGFRAFEIIRDEISKLVSTLNPSAEFNVLLFDPGQNNDQADIRIEMFRPALVPATINNRQALIDWMSPINTDMTKLGFGSVVNGVRWKPKKLDNAGLDPQYRATSWSNAFRAAMELKPDTVFLITGRTSPGIRDATAKEIADRRKARIERAKDYEKRGIDLVAVSAARNAALKKAAEELAAINKQQLAKKKDPFIIQGTGRIMDADFQAALKKAGYSITVDTKGWTDKEGRIIRDGPLDLSKPEADWTWAELKDQKNYFWKLQTAFAPQNKIKLNLFLFVGPDEDTKRLEPDLKELATANNGRFALLDTKKLEQMQKDAAAREAKK